MVFQLQREEDYLLYCDSDILQKVFNRLMTNAIKYADEGGAITISCQQVADDLQVSFFNSGTIIAPNVLANIFLPYDTEDIQTKNFTHCGLGLSFVKKR